MANTVACFCKATEGTTYINSDYARARADAARRGVFFGAYAFLHHGNAAAQARHAHNVVGNATPLMVDVEPTSGSNPTVGDCTAFVDEYRRLGGIVHLVYLPKWYWGRTSLGEMRGHADRGIIGRRSQRVAPAPHEVICMASPSLSSLASRGLCLVSSDYTTYSDSGPGWAPYGGMAPMVWQYTDRFPFNGHSVDFNAFKGSGSPDVTKTEAEFRNVAMTGKLSPAPAPAQEEDVSVVGCDTWPQEAAQAGQTQEQQEYFACVGDDTDRAAGDKRLYYQGPETGGKWVCVDQNSHVRSGATIKCKLDGAKTITYVNADGVPCAYDAAPGSDTWVWRSLGGRAA